MKLRLWEDGRATKEMVVDKKLVRIGRDPRCEFALDPAIYPKVSGLHAQLQLEGNELKLTPLSKSNQTLLNDSPIAGVKLLKAGDRIRLGFTGPMIEIVGLTHTPSPKPIVLPRLEKSIDVEEEAPATVMAGNASDYLGQPSGTEQFDIGKSGIIGRDAKLAAYVLDHPQVSRVHARLTVTSKIVSLTDLGSSNGTFCNGFQVVGSRVLVPGDTIDIGPFGLVFDGTSLKGRSRAGNVQLRVADVNYTVINTKDRSKLTLLNEVELVINPGEFLCILGPSGSGKSTLLNVMSGRRPPSKGNVFINNRDLHANFSALKQDLAVVPQASVLHDMLTVEQSFGFTSELRLPQDLSRDELDACVDSAITTVGLDQRRTVRISQLSGGQLKRAGLGGELLSDPSLLFLDEVTSGLDEHSDGEMMRLFRGLADAGKTLVCITHNLAHVEECCHLVAVLTVGGRLAFLGSPAEALAYFRISKLSDIYTELKIQSPEQWARSYRTSKHYLRYLESRRTKLQTLDVDVSSMTTDRRRVSALRQLNVLLRRTIAVWRGDIASLGALFGQALLVAALLCVVFGKIEEAEELNPMARIGKIRNLLFLITVSCFWLGCNNSVKEIVKERSIFRRERDYNLVPESYFASKLVFLGVIGIAQSILLSIIVFAWCSMPGYTSQMLGTVTALSLAGTALGLAISANAKNEEVAVALVPIVVIPQIILAGVVATLPKFSEWIARFTISAFWGQHAVNDCLPDADQFGADSKLGYYFSMFVILMHSLAFIAMGWLGIRRRI